MANETFITKVIKGGIIRYFKDIRFNPVSKTTPMTQEVGVDSSGRLWTKPSEDITDKIFRATIIQRDNKFYLQLENSGNEIINAVSDGNVMILVSTNVFEIDADLIFRPALYMTDIDAGLASFICDFAFINDNVKYMATITSDETPGDDVLLFDITPITRDKSPFIFEYDAEDGELSGFTTDHKYIEIENYLSAGRDVRCRVRCGASYFYLTLNRQIYDGSAFGDNMFSFDTNTYYGSLVMWFINLKIFEDDSVEYSEGSYEVLES